MQAIEQLKSSVEVSKFSKVCDVPNWLKEAVDGTDTKETNDRIKELCQNQIDCIAKFEEIKNCDCISSIHQAVKKNKQEAKHKSLNCIAASSKSVGLSKSMML